MKELDENSAMNERGKSRFKLEEMDRKNIFRVPENYFEELPSIIQARVTSEEKQSWIKRWVNDLAPTPALRMAYVTAVVAVIAVVSGIFLRPGSTESVDDLLASVSVDDLIEYLDYSGITTDEILAQVDVSQLDDNFFEDEIQLLNDNELEQISLDDLYDEFGLMESDSNDL